MTLVRHIDSPPREVRPSSDPAPELGLDLRDLVQVVWSARWAIGLCMIIGAAIAFVMVKQITPQYRAAASIILDIRDQNVINIESVLSDTPLNRELLETELLVIESDPLLERVVDKLQLHRDPEYNPRLSQPSELSLMIEERKAQAIALLGLGEYFPAPEGASEPEAAVADPRMVQAEDRRRAVRILRRKLRTRQLSPAYAIKVEVTSSDPVRASLIANAVADQYVADQLEAKFTAARRATTWLMGRVEQLRERVEESAAAVQAYTTVNQTGDSQAANITSQQIVQLNAALITAQADVAQSTAKFNQAKEMVSSLGALRAASALSSPLIASLREQRATLARSETELSTRYGPKHPRMVEVRSELADVDRSIAGEVRQILNGLENEQLVSEARVSSLTSALSDLEYKASGQSEASVGLSQLEAEAEANRSIYNNFLQRLNETREQEGFQTADSRVIEPATPAFAPFMPRSKVTTAMGGVAGGAVGFGFVILMRLLNRSVRTPLLVSERTGLSVTANIPRIRRRYAGKNLLAYLKERPNSELAESVRYLRNAIIAKDGSVKSVLITSALPEEGKMTLTVLLGEMMARMEKSVLVIDADFRRPKIAKTLGIDVKADLVSVLRGASTLEEAIYRPRNAAFDVIPLHLGQADKADLLALPRMKALIAMLGGEYDFVVIEGPPVLGVGDFSVLGRIVDTSIMAIEWNKTPVSAVERAVQWLTDHQVHIFGAVLTKVDRRRAANMDATGNSASYGSLHHYYLN